MNYLFVTYASDYPRTWNREGMYTSTSVVREDMVDDFCRRHYVMAVDDYPPADVAERLRMIASCVSGD